MTLYVYKGFEKDYLAQLDGTPLVEGDISAKIDVLAFSKKTRKALERELLDLEDDDKAWVTYQEYSLIKARVDDAISEDGLEVVIYGDAPTGSAMDDRCAIATISTRMYWSAPYAQHSTAWTMFWMW
jgi:hypothetical protein